jgi:hypothetical protein
LWKGRRRLSAWRSPESNDDSSAAKGVRGVQKALVRGQLRSINALLDTFDRDTLGALLMAAEAVAPMIQPALTRAALPGAVHVAALQSGGGGPNEMSASRGTEPMSGAVADELLEQIAALKTEFRTAVQQQQQQQRKLGMCWVCGETGHIKAACPKRKDKSDEKSAKNKTADAAGAEAATKSGKAQ